MVVVVGSSLWLTLEVGVARVIKRLPLGRITLVPVVPLHFLGFFFVIDFFFLNFSGRCLSPVLKRFVPWACARLKG